MKVKNRYGADLELDLSEETKKMFPRCVNCWKDPKVFEQESFICGHYGPCNLYPLLQVKK